MASMPTLPTVTIYALGVSGQVVKIEARLKSHGRTDQIAGNYLEDFGGGAPYVVFLRPRERNGLVLERADGGRYILVLKGTGHPDPIPLRLGDETNAHRDYRLLEPWDALIDKHIARDRVPVVADYRDIV